MVTTPVSAANEPIRAAKRARSNLALGHRRAPWRPELAGIHTSEVTQRLRHAVAIEAGQHLRTLGALRADRFDVVPRAGLIGNDPGKRVPQLGDWRLGVQQAAARVEVN